MGNEKTRQKVIDEKENKTLESTNKHPTMGPVIFIDSSEDGGSYRINSVAVSDKTVTMKINGEDVVCYVIHVNTSSKTHPSYSGKMGTWSDTDNRIKGFNEKSGMFV